MNGTIEVLNKVEIFFQKKKILELKRYLKFFKFARWIQQLTENDRRVSDIEERAIEFIKPKEQSDKRLKK